MECHIVRDEEDMKQKREEVKEFFKSRLRDKLFPSVEKLMGRHFRLIFEKFYTRNKLKYWLKGGNFKNPVLLKDQLKLIDQ